MAEKIRCLWQSAGEVTLPGAKLAFPRVPDAPGLYRFVLVGPPGPVRVYIGQSGHLRRRLRHYQSPGGPEESGTTKYRVNAQLREALQSGCRVAVDIAVQVEGADLTVKAGRRAAENAELAGAQRAGYAVLNR
jgi:hypothetical protein